jgi:hypothetical protein
MDAKAPDWSEIEPIERETVKQVVWRLMPLLILGYFIAYQDRTNASGQRLSYTVARRS